MTLEPSTTPLDTKDNPTIHCLPRLIRFKEAPRYLGMDRHCFNREVRPYIAPIRIGKQGIAFDRLDLDDWVIHRKKETPPTLPLPRGNTALNRAKQKTVSLKRPLHSSTDFEHLANQLLRQKKSSKRENSEKNT